MPAPLPAWVTTVARTHGVDLTGPAPSIITNPALPSAPTPKEGTVMSTTIPTITRADRPLNNVWTKDLVQMVLDLDPHAVIEAQLRLTHTATLKPHNRKRLVAALAAIASPPEAEVAPEPEAAPVDPVKAAMKEAERRAKALAPEGDRIRAGMRARKAVRHFELTLEDLADLADAELAELVATPIR